MVVPDTRPIPLTDLPTGAVARVLEIRGGRRLVRQLLGLGLRVGSRVTVVHHRGRGIVLSNGAVRIALGGGVADKLWAQRLDEPGQIV